MGAAIGDDGLEGFEVGDVFVDDGFVDDLPEMFGGLKLGGVGRKEQQSDSVGDHEVALAMPTGVVEDEDDDSVFAGAGFIGEGAQQRLEERLRDAVGDIPEAFAGRGRNESGDVEPFEAMMTGGDRARADRRPNPAHDRLQAEPMFVGREGFDGEARMGLPLLGDDLGDFFLNVSCSSALAALGLRGRGFWIDQPIALSASQPR